MTIYIILQGQPLEDLHRNRLVAELAGHEVIFGHELRDDRERRSAVDRAEIVFGNPPPDWLQSAARLKWVQLDSAGVDAYLGLAAEGRVLISNLHDFYNQAVGECALAGILAFHRRIPELSVAQRDRAWIKEEVSRRIGRLHRAKVVILGAGGIACRLASLLRPFEGEVLLYARHSAEAKLRTAGELDAVLPATDVLVNTLPHTPETIGFLDRARLRRLKPGALLVNMGRGSALDEAALEDGLESGAIGGAVLDVTAREPLPPESPLWRHPQVLLTQHTGGRFPGETTAKLDCFLGNLRRFQRGETLEGLLDPARGY